MYLVAPLNLELADVGEQRIREVSHALTDVPGADDWPGLGLGFQQEGLERPAAIILHTDLSASADVNRIATAITNAATEQGLTVPAIEVMTDDDYERLALEQAVVVPREHIDPEAAIDLGEDT